MPEPTAEQFKATINILRQQREAAHDQIVQLGTQLTLMSAELEEVKKQLKALNGGSPLDSPN